MPATQRYKVCPKAPIPHQAIGPQEGGRLGRGCGSSEGRPVGSGLDVNLPVY